MYIHVVKTPSKKTGQAITSRDGAFDIKPRKRGLSILAYEAASLAHVLNINCFSRPFRNEREAYIVQLFNQVLRLACLMAKSDHGTKTTSTANTRRLLKKKAGGLGIRLIHFQETCLHPAMLTWCKGSIESDYTYGVPEYIHYHRVPTSPLSLFAATKWKYSCPC